MSNYEDDRSDDCPNDRNGDSDTRRNRYRDEVYSKRVPAGKRTYFFDVKSTRSGEDFFVTITESKRLEEGRYLKHKLFLYKEDFGKFIEALHEVVDHIRDECLPDHDFDDVPVLSDPHDDYDDDFDEYDEDEDGDYDDDYDEDEEYDEDDDDASDDAFRSEQIDEERR